MLGADTSQYAMPRDWSVKVFSMPNIPRGSQGMILTLRTILNELKNNTPVSTALKIEGSDSKATLDHLCVRLRPMGIIIKTPSGWEISREAGYWLETANDFYLAAIFHANIKFFSEILAFFDRPKTSNEIREYANVKFKLTWKTSSDVHNRLVWLRDFGFVNFQDYNLMYSITDLGREFLNTVVPVKPQEIAKESDVTQIETNIPVSDWALNLITSLTEDALKNRKPSIGYIPGSKTLVCETIGEYLQLMENEIDQEIIRKYAEESFNIKNSSLNSFLSTLTTLGLIEKKSRTTYQTSELGIMWNADKREVDFVCCLQAKVCFIFELLFNLQDESKTARSLAAMAKVSYGFVNDNVSELQTRLSILKSARLVQEEGLDKFAITSRGQKLLSMVNVQQPMANIDTLAENTDASKEVITNSINSALEELRVASRDSSNPSRFEKAVQNGFRILGFNVQWIGGSGNTDVLLSVPGTEKSAYKVTVDAKSTASGSVNESMIDFDTLEDHRKKHHADYKAVVGCQFQNDRLIQRAKEHKVVLIDIDAFEKIVKMHTEIPLLTSDYREIFKSFGSINLGSIINARRRMQNTGDLLRLVMEYSEKESKDPLTEGILTEKDIYRSIRDNGTLDGIPGIEEIRNMLEFLSSPLIGCIQKVKEGYSANASIFDAANIFAFYARKCRADK